ncbi:MAG: glycosyltransferase [Cytophagales bacterium]
MDEVIKKKILLIFPDFGFGGAERSVASLSMLLAEHYEVHYVVFNTLLTTDYSFGGHFHSLEVKAKKHAIGKIVALFQRISRLRLLKDKLKPHASISFLEGADYVNVLSKKSEKVILCLRGSKRYDPNIKGLTGFLRKKISIPFTYKRGDHIVSVAEGILNEMNEDFGLSAKVKRTVISNFYNVRELKSKSQENLDLLPQAFFKEHTVFVATGRLAYEKGFHLLAEVFCRVVPIVQHAKLIFVGEGDYKKQIQERIEKNQVAFSPSDTPLNPSASILFVGYQSNPLKWIARANFFVLSSFTEGFPNVMLEAMAVGTPVIAADCPYGPADILSTGNDFGVFRKYGMLLPLLSDDGEILNKWAKYFIEIINNKKIYDRYAHQADVRVKEYNAYSALAKWVKVID